MKTSLFDFHLPDERIAVRPAAPRESARMLVIGERLQDKTIRDLPEFLKPGDLLVMNDTRVIPARLIGTRGDMNVEVLLHRRIGADGWRTFVRPAKKLKDGQVINFADDFSAAVQGRYDTGELALRFNHEGANLMRMIETHGRMPLPPYIEKQRSADARDVQDYQTVYAKKEGASVAAPTAGLHFTDAMLAALEAKGVKRAHVTLHVGAGTFQPVKVEDVREHVMHSEWAEVSAETAALVNETKRNGGRVIAVGTTSLRTLESACGADGVLRPFSADTDIFITPGYRFTCADMLMTNFHLPKSTLFMLVSAFSGLERMQAAYAHAIAQHYRFYSYGDACLLYKETT